MRKKNSGKFRTVRKIFQAALMLLVMTAPVRMIQAQGAAESTQKTIVFCDKPWDTVQIQNRIIGFIIEHGFSDYEVKFTETDQFTVLETLTSGTADVDMEYRRAVLPGALQTELAAETLFFLGESITGAAQGWWMPRYAAEEAFGSEAADSTEISVITADMLEDLQRKTDMPLEIFLGAESWTALEFSQTLFSSLGLNDCCIPITLPTAAVHAAQMVDAYMNQRIWIGYYWTPSTVFGSLDMVPIEDAVFPPLSIRKLVRSDLRRYPDLFNFIETYELTADQMSELLAVRDETAKGLNLLVLKASNVNLQYRWSKLPMIPQQASIMRK